MTSRSSQFSSFLKLGSNKEKKLFDYLAGREAFDGVLVSSMMLESYFDRTSGFLKGLGKPYIVDPATYTFQLKPLARQAVNGHTKKSYLAMAEHFGSPVKEIVASRGLIPSDLLADPEMLQSFTGRVLDYQRSRVKGGASLFDDLEDFLVSEDLAPLRSTPEVLIPPYFYFKSVSDPWYSVNLACARAGVKAAGANESVWPVILMSGQLLTEIALINKICADFDSLGCKGFLIWVNDFRDEKQSQIRLRGLSELVGILSSQRKPVLRLYGGYFSFLLKKRGLSGFSCGPGYGSSKNSFAYARKGGPSVPTFYIEKLKAGFQLDEAEAILRRHPELICECAVCRSTYGKDLDRFRKMAESGRCQSHFLNVRAREISVIRASKIPDSVATELMTTVESMGPVNTQHLSAWLTAAGYSLSSQSAA